MVVLENILYYHRIFCIAVYRTRSRKFSQSYMIYEQGIEYLSCFSRANRQKKHKKKLLDVIGLEERKIHLHTFLQKCKVCSAGQLSAFAEGVRFWPEHLSAEFFLLPVRVSAAKNIDGIGERYGRLRGVSTELIFQAVT